MHLARLGLNAGIAGLLEERSGLSDNFRPPENKICLSPKAFCSRKWFDFFGASYARSRYQRAFDRLWRGPNLRNRTNLFPAITTGDQRAGGQEREVATLRCSRTDQIEIREYRDRLRAVFSFGSSRINPRLRHQA